MKTHDYSNGKTAYMPKNKYSFFQKIKLGIFLLRTKLICRKARLIRFPIEIRNRRFIDFGTCLTTGRGCRIEAYSRRKNISIRFGDNVQLNDYVHISAMENVTIGNNVLVASHVTIIDNNHGSYSGNSKDVSPEVPPIKRPYSMSAISIEDNVWIGEHAVILQGVTLGEGCVIGANSVVTKSIPPHVIAVGSPAKPVKIFDFIQQRWVKYEDTLKNEAKLNEQV